MVAAIKEALKRALLPWPVVPARLWLTGVGAGLALLSLIFKQELWPGHPRAADWSLVALALLMQAGGIQAIVVLWRWPRASAGPGWMRLAARGVAWAGIIGIAILLLPLLLLSCLLVAGLVPD